MVYQELKYQLDHVDDIIRKVATKRKVVACSPTGAGKTVEFALICKRYLAKNPTKSILILVNRLLLLEQAIPTVHLISRVKPSLITAGSLKPPRSNIYIGMAESVKSRLGYIDNLGLVIIDEAHVNQFNKFIGIFNEEYIIGFTATPKSGNKKEPMIKYYNDISVCPWQIPELIQHGFLTQNVTRIPSYTVDVSKIGLNNLDGDYNEKELAAEYSKANNVTNTIRTWAKVSRGKKTLVFNVNIAHSKLVTDCFNTCGFEARHIDSEMSDSVRDENIAWFRNTPGAILNNVMITTYGFDEEDVETIVENFTTLSITKHLQACGRGGRILRKKQGFKPYFTIIDMGGNWEIHGEWNQPRDWEYIFNFPDKPGKGLPPVKTCPQCGGIVHAAKRACELPLAEGGLCDYEWEKKKKAEEVPIVDVRTITKTGVGGIDIAKLIEEGNKKSQAYYGLWEIGRQLIDSFELPFPELMLKYKELSSEWAKKKGFGDKIGNDWHNRVTREHLTKLYVTKYKVKDCRNRNDVGKIELCQYCDDEIYVDNEKVPEGYCCDKVECSSEYQWNFISRPA